jgi:hypothetical protein
VQGETLLKKGGGMMRKKRWVGIFLGVAILGIAGLAFAYVNQTSSSTFNADGDLYKSIVTVKSGVCPAEADSQPAVAILLMCPDYNVERFNICYEDVENTYTYKTIPSDDPVCWQAILCVRTECPPAP